MNKYSVIAKLFIISLYHYKYDIPISRLPSELANAIIRRYKINQKYKEKQPFLKS